MKNWQTRRDYWSRRDDTPMPVDSYYRLLMRVTPVRADLYRWRSDDIQVNSRKREEVR
jgi:hypothetical protein